MKDPSLSLPPPEAAPVSCSHTRAQNRAVRPGQARADPQIRPPPSHRTCLPGTAHPRACCPHRGPSTSKPPQARRRPGGTPVAALNLVTFKKNFSCTSVTNIMCAFFLSLFFSCYAVKAGGSEGNGTTLSFPERSRSQLSGFQRTLSAYRRLQREVTFQEAAGPDGRQDRSLRRAGRRGFTRRGWRRGWAPGEEAREEYGTLSPKYLVRSRSRTPTVHLVQPFPHNNFINRESQAQLV